MDEVAVVGLLGISLIYLIIGGVIFLIIMILSCLQTAGMWKMFEKAGKPKWASLIPYYNFYLLSEITLGCGWWFFLIMVPYVGTVYNVYLYYNLTRSFGNPWPYTIGLTLAPFVFFPLMGFDKNPYLGVTKNIFNQNQADGVI